MYCCHCGTKLAEEAVYCHKCGASVSPDQTSISAQTKDQQHSQDLDQEDRALVNELLAIDRKSNRCHSCDRAEDLLSWKFGVGKPVSKKLQWGETAISVVLSALTLPLIGVGAVQLPGRTTRLRILPLNLVLCKQCIKSKKGYECHPWWAALRRHGYTEFVSADDLAKLPR